MYVDWVPKRRCYHCAELSRRHQFRETSSRTLSAKYVSKAYKRLELVIQSYLALRLNYVTHTLNWQLNCRKLRRASRDWILKRESTSVCAPRAELANASHDNFIRHFSPRYCDTMKRHACPSYSVTSRDAHNARGCDNTSCLLIGHWGIFSVSALWLGNFKY